MCPCDKISSGMHGDIKSSVTCNDLCKMCSYLQCILVTKCLICHCAYVCNRSGVSNVSDMYDVSNISNDFDVSYESDIFGVSNMSNV